MAQRLKVLRLDTVGFVDAGANQLADIMIWKRAPEQGAGTEGPGVVDTEEATGLRKFLRVVGAALHMPSDLVEEAAKDAANITATGVSDMTQKLDITSLPEDAQAYITTLQEQAEAATQAATEAASALEEMEKAAAAEGGDDDPAGDEMLKGLPDELRKAVEARVAKAETEAAEAVALAKAEQQARKHAECSKQAEIDYPHLPGAVDDKGRALMVLEALGDEGVRETITTMLRAGDDAMAKAATPAGPKDEQDKSGNSAWDTIQGRAEAMVADKQADTVAVAVGKVLDADPELAARYSAERQAGR
jgi:hypothetical protein